MDILEGVVDEIRFGTANASDNIVDSLTRIDLSGSPNSTVHIQVQTQAVKETYVASVDGLECLVDNVCKWMSTVRSAFGCDIGDSLELCSKPGLANLYSEPRLCPRIEAATAETEATAKSTDCGQRHRLQQHSCLLINRRKLARQFRQNIRACLRHRLERLVHGK